MTAKSDYLIDSIFKKLQEYKNKKIYLKKENFKRFMSSLLNEK
tara:strand:- start:864 stop:992 length:129 start_codon:yes stop_codon:yes gene_type:complete